MKLIYSNRFLLHDCRDLPESKERLVSIISFLKEKNLNKFVAPLQINETDLLIVHTQQLIEEIKNLSKQKAFFPDNPFSENTFEIALLAAGAALKAALLCFNNGFCFSLARPPGHHAGKNSFAGFCYFNNIAFAVKKVQLLKKVERIMIVDFDLHHGNGTQEIFYNEKNVFYLSFHQNPLYSYPGTGFERENNEHVKNVPIEAGANDAQYLKIFKKNLSLGIESFQPELIAISAGFDIFYKDTIVGNQLQIKKPNTFYSIGKEIKSASSVPCFAVLEGGYFLPMLGENLFNFLNSFI